MTPVRFALLAMAFASCSRAAEPRTAPAAHRDAGKARADAGVDQLAGGDTRAIQLALGHDHSCALFADGTVRCWGPGAEGRLGTGSTNNLGDDEPAGQARPIELGGRAIAIAAGEAHTCALLESKHLRCWGRGKQGQLGYGRALDVGDDETPASAGNVPLSEEVTAVSAGGNVTCALLASGGIRCWGDNFERRLGYQRRKQPRYLGDDEAVELMPPILFERRVFQLACEAWSTCVLFDDGGVKCWGAVPGSPDSEVAAMARTDIEVGTPVARLSFATISCVVTKDKHARCWGMSNALAEAVGVARNNDDMELEAVADVGDLPIVGSIASIALSRDHGCALLEGGEVRCWGDRRLGILGVPPGDSVSAKDAILVDVGAPAVAVAVGAFHSCTITEAGGIRCWGIGKDGRLGYGSLENVGEKRPPSAVGDVIPPGHTQP